ncbi:MAG: hypothetical protein HYZ57_06220 [Acidobacteria bacterium]|nr:hypothetical protein [Acidobacteriota bacterium]
MDATAEAGPVFGESLYIGRYQIDCGYPLVAETLRLCFNLDALPAGNSIEDLFADAMRGDYGPIRKLADRLREADYRIANRLASAGTRNSYQEFFDAFPDANFLTFNYDSLPETFLYRLGRWCPHDGYGVRVAAHLPPGADALAIKNSRALVLHLHGSLCIRTSACEIQRETGQAMAMLAQRDEPLYAFDPSSISGNFTPFDRDVGADDVEDRIIAPVPDKSQGLKEAFIRDTYSKAEAVLRNSDTVVTIGYSFNQHDRASYQRLLRAFGESLGRKLLLVSPDAGTIADAIRPAFPKLAIIPLEATFKQWVSASFPGPHPSAVQP